MHRLQTIANENNPCCKGYIVFCKLYIVCFTQSELTSGHFWIASPTAIAVDQRLSCFTKSGLASGYFLAMTAMAFAIGKMVIA